MVQLQGGKKMSFLEISGLRGKQKEDIINKMTDEEYSGYDKYIENRKQAANQRI
jgi:hypothetical protein